MYCHRKEITKDWLFQQNLYFEHLNSSFQVIKLNEERQGSGGDQRQKLTQQIQEIEDEEVQESQQTILHELILSLDEQQKDYPCYKKGGIFNSVTQRQCQFQKTTLGQSKQGNIITKTYGDIKLITIQSFEQVTKDFKWDVNSQQYGMRLIFNFIKHGPVWIYAKNTSEAKKYYNYFKCHKALKDNLQQVFKEAAGLVKDCYAMKLNTFIERFAIQVVIQRKKAAKLAKDESKFLADIDKKIFRSILQKKWLARSIQFIKKEEKLNQLEEEERKRLEEIQKQDESKKNYWRQFLASKQSLQVELVDCLRPLMTDWLEKSEYNQQQQKVKELIFYLNIKSINIEDHIKLIKPTLFVELIQIDQNSKLSMEAYIGQQKTDKFYNWLLKELLFENKNGKVQYERKPCNFIISSINNNDILQLQFKDMVNAFYDTTTLLFNISVQDLLQQSQQGRSIWVPLKLIQQNALKTETKESLLYVEIDIYVKPSLMIQNSNSYEEELEYIAEHNLAFSDPIYMGTIQLPKINRDIIKFILITLEESNLCMKQSMQMLSYILFLQQTNPDMINKQIRSLTILFMRKVILNLCHNFGLMPQQITLYDQVINRITLTNITNIKNPQLLDQANKLFINGIPYYQRNQIWFQLLSITFNPLKKILNEIYKQNLDNNDKINESLFLYQKLILIKQNLKKTILQQIDQYLRQEDNRKGFGNEAFYHQLKDLLICFLLYQGNLGLIPNQSYIHHIFTIAKKMLTMQNYYHIRYNEYSEFGNEQKQTQSDILNESRAFWLLVGFSNQVLTDYPLYEGQDNRLFLEQCAKLRVFLNKCHNDLYNKMFLYGIEVENELYELFFNLYSDILPSEILYRVWDIIIYQQLQSIKAISERGNIIISIAATLLLRIKKKINNISTHLSFLAAIKIEAMLINDVTLFLNEVLQTQKELNQAVQIEYQEEGPLKLEQQIEFKIKTDYRLFDVLDEKFPKGSQQMQVYQYLNYIDF